MLTFLSVCNELWVVRPLLPLRELKLTSSCEVCRPEVREVLRRGVRLVRPPLAIPDGADCPQQKAHRRQLQEHPDLTFLVAIPRLPSPSAVLRQFGVRTANFPPLRISRCIFCQRHVHDAPSDPPLCLRRARDRRWRRSGCALPRWTPSDLPCAPSSTGVRSWARAAGEETKGWRGTRWEHRYVPPRARPKLLDGWTGIHEAAAGPIADYSQRIAYSAGQWLDSSRPHRR